MSNIKVFGREPAIVVGVVASFLTFVAATEVPFLSAGQAAAATALVAAAVLAYTTRPVAPSAFTGIFAALVALLAEYRIDLSDELVGAITGLILAVFAFVARQQVTPEDTVLTRKTDFGLAA